MLTELGIQLAGKITEMGGSAQTGAEDFVGWEDVIWQGIAGAVICAGINILMQSEARRTKGRSFDMGEPPAAAFVGYVVASIFSLVILN